VIEILLYPHGTKTHAERLPVLARRAT